MKTLTKNGVSIYLFDDDTEVNVTKLDIEVGNPTEFIISDCSSLDTTLYDNVTAPEDWIGHKYLFDGNEWLINPEYTVPENVIWPEQPV